MTFVASALLAFGCDDRRSNGEACLKDRDCESENCRSSVCAPVPSDTPMTVGPASGPGGSGGQGVGGVAGGPTAGGGAGGGFGGVGGMPGLGGSAVGGSGGR